MGSYLVKWQRILSNTNAISLKGEKDWNKWPLNLQSGAGFSSMGGDGFIKITMGFGKMQRGILSRSLGAKDKRPT